MVDMNSVIAGNILAILRQQNKRQVDLAETLNMNKQIVNKMLNGSRVISASELKVISDFLGVTMEDLTKVRNPKIDTDIIHAFMGKVESDGAKNALKIADTLSNMILFHATVRENGAAMMEGWDD